jgi:hypothetical protein
MSDNNPDLLAVKNFEKKDGGHDAAWRQIGAAWFHKDGEGLDVVLEALPVSGRVVLRKFKDKT